MATTEPKRRLTAVVVLMIAAVAGLCVVAAFMIPHILTRMRSATFVNPTNFDDANTEFFETLSNREIAIVSLSAKKPADVEQNQFRIVFVPLQEDPTRIADQDNKRAHANGTVLVYACHEVLHGNKELGGKLLRLLQDHDPDIRYNYPTSEKTFRGGYKGANIYINELVDAAERASIGDMSKRELLERPASQYEWRERKYSRIVNP